MTILVTNSKPGHTSTTIMYNKKRFKISCKNDNYYTCLKIYMYTANGLAEIADSDDIQGAIEIEYCWPDNKRMKAQEDNIRLAIEYIKLVF